MTIYLTLIHCCKIMMILVITAQKKKFSIKDFFSKCDQIPSLLGNFIEITLRHGCSPVNLLHIFRTIFPRNTSGWLLLHTEFAFMSQKQFSRGALKKRRSENMQRIYKRTPMSKYDFIKVALRLY